jgi:LEA14-like dessication related protein
MPSMQVLIKRSATWAVTGLVASAALAGCARLKAPQIFVEGIRVEKVLVTGVAMDVRFRIHNPNPDPLDIENFEYELSVNETRLGRGYQVEPVHLRGFGEAKAASRFQLTILAVPTGLQAVLSHEPVRVRAQGIFHVRPAGHDLREIPFSTEASVALQRRAPDENPSQTQGSESAGATAPDAD